MFFKYGLKKGRTFTGSRGRLRSGNLGYGWRKSKNICTGKKKTQLILFPVNFVFHLRGFQFWTISYIVMENFFKVPHKQANLTNSLAYDSKNDILWCIRTSCIYL